MRDIRELKKAFGRADEAFVNNLYYTLANIQMDERRKPVKKIGFRLVAAIVIGCMLSAGTVLAFTNSWGILDFLRGRWENVKVLPEAADLVQKGVVQEGGQTEFGNFVVREAVFDGKSLYIVMDVKPSSSGYLLLGPDAFPSDPISNMGPFFSGKLGTIADYAREGNKEMISTSVGIDGAISCSIDYILEEGGTLVYMLNGNISSSSAQEEIKINCVAVPFISREGKMVIDDSNKQKTTISITLKNSGTKESVTSIMPVIYSDFGIRVDKVILTASAMDIYADIEYTVIDREKFAQNEDGLLFEFLDNTGNPIPGGVSSGEGIQALDRNRFIQKISLQASETLPNEITLRAYNCWRKDSYESHTFKMK
ncbi:MAG TPA: hypothetical protein GXX38_02380 [Clostridia bacterium]|nr:hypothetical protein [Clostridia bacterium]